VGSVCASRAALVNLGVFWHFWLGDVARSLSGGFLSLAQAVLRVRRVLGPGSLLIRFFRRDLIHRFSHFHLSVERLL